MGQVILPHTLYYFQYSSFAIIRIRLPPRP
jgi:hypothetical protein